MQNFNNKSATQFRAISNFEQVHKLFYTDAFCNTYYPDDYSGSWIDGENLYIALTDTSDCTIKKYTANLPFPQNVKFDKMIKSLNELNAEQAQYLTISNIGKAITSYHIDVKSNKCVFEVEESSVDNIPNMIKDSILSVDPKYTFSINDIMIKSAEFSTPDTNIIGGMEAALSNRGFSVGVCGTITMSSGTTYDGICSCGHNKSISDLIKIKNNEFGKVCVLKYGDKLTGDYSCIRMTSTTDTLTNKVYGSSTSYTRNITATVENVPVNTAVMKFGATSGYATATVYAIDASVTQTVNETKIPVKGMTQCTLEEGTCAGGDSGGPYYISAGSGNNYKFIGVHSSHSGDSITFTPYIRFKSYFSPKTS